MQDNPGAPPGEVCRICRLEETSETPLLHPCKCNGSIKYVHPSCLMDWLSHTQKSQCELCKTPFRFTRVYASDMPRSISNTLYLKHSVVHISRWIAVIVRGIFVTSVWFCWVPYLMRRLWTCLFWISDIGLGVAPPQTTNFTPAEIGEFGLMTDLFICKSTPLLKSDQCPPMAQISRHVYDVAVSSAGYNGFAALDSPSWIVSALRICLHILFPGSANKGEILAFQTGNIVPPGRSGSILSHVTWLNNLTVYPSLNMALVRALEGIILTIAVMVGFVLVIIVKDYVGNHQPAVNAGPVQPIRPAQRVRAAQPAPPAPPAQQPLPVPAALPPLRPARVPVFDQAFNQEHERNLDPEQYIPRDQDIWETQEDDLDRISDASSNENTAPLSWQQAALDERQNDPLMKKAQEDYIRIMQEFQDEYPFFVLEVSDEKPESYKSRYWMYVYGPEVDLPTRMHRHIKVLKMHARYFQSLDLSSEYPLRLQVIANCSQAFELDSTGNKAWTQSDIGIGLLNFRYGIDYHPQTAEDFAWYTFFLIRYNGIRKDMIKGLELYSDLPGLDPRMKQDIQRSYYDGMKPNPDLNYSGLPASTIPSGDDPNSITDVFDLDQWAMENEPAQSRNIPREALLSLNYGEEPEERESPAEQIDSAYDLPGLREGEAGPSTNAPDNSAIKGAHASNWSFSALESQPLFARTRDDENVPFMNSSPTAPDSSQADAADLDARFHDNTEQTAPVDNSDWETLPDENEDRAVMYHGLPEDSTHLVTDSDGTRFVESIDDLEHVADVHREEPQANQPTIVTGNSSESTDEHFDVFEIPHPTVPRFDLEDDSPAINDTATELPAPRPADHMEQADEEDDNYADEAENTNINVANANGNDEPEVAEQPQPRGLQNAVLDFMWGPLQAGHQLENANIRLNRAGNQGHDAVIDWAPNAADEFLDDELNEGLDGEDLDGILELLGFVGPAIAIISNAAFCACIVLVSLMVYVITPYNIGRISAWILVHPLMLVWSCLATISVVQDLCLMTLSALSWAISAPFYWISYIAGWGNTLTKTTIFMNKAKIFYLTQASEYFDALHAFIFYGTSLPVFTRSTHQSILAVKQFFWKAITFVFMLLPNILSALATGSKALIDFKNWDVTYVANATNSTLSSTSLLKNLTLPNTISLFDPSGWVIRLDIDRDIEMITGQTISPWTASDRAIAIFLGYVTLIALGAAYLRYRPHFISYVFTPVGEQDIAEFIYQAADVLKVLAIISTEMIIFPLYCGILIDIATLPLFDGHSIATRLAFTTINPTTSIFVHWFAGTGYMFHFALFVSMCRKILRKGVLYFVRDPDDPNFHPVREVLERKFFNQLRKIGFSAMIYGLLIVVCLGGVVWSLAYTCTGLFPIHYSSNEPVLEFPVDLLVYNFFLPVAVRFFKPEAIIQKMYRFCFRRCAACLRLTWWAFGERRIEEEGVLLNPKTGEPLSWYEASLMKYENGHYVKGTWKSWFNIESYIGTPGRFNSKSIGQKRGAVIRKELRPDGIFVYAPNCDHIKIPKNQKAFYPVDEDKILEPFEVPEDFDETPDHFKVVYLPPRFYLRVFVFVLMIWMFAAVTGVAMAVIPLFVGRFVFNYLLPDHVRTNDIYAFFLGLYGLATLIWANQRVLSTRQEFMRVARQAYSRAVIALCGEQDIKKAPLAILKVVCTYSVLLFIFPILISLALELYVILPLHTWFYPDPEPSNRHVIPLIQLWVVGLMMMKLIVGYLCDRYANRLFGRAMNAIFLRGMFHPNVEIFFRAFVVPGALITLVTFITPLLMARLMISYRVFTADNTDVVATAHIFRWAFPGTVIWVLLMYGSFSLISNIAAWKKSVRDDLYCVGARLHNYGEDQAQQLGAPVVVDPDDVHLLR